MKALIRKTIILILVFMTLFTSIMPTNVALAVQTVFTEQEFLNTYKDTADLLTATMEDGEISIRDKENQLIKIEMPPDKGNLLFFDIVAVDEEGNEYKICFDSFGSGYIFINNKGNISVNKMTFDNISLEEFSASDGYKDENAYIYKAISCERQEDEPKIYLYIYERGNSSPVSKIETNLNFDTIKSDEHSKKEYRDSIAEDVVEISKRTEYSVDSNPKTFKNVKLEDLDDLNRNELKGKKGIIISVTKNGVYKFQMAYGGDKEKQVPKSSIEIYRIDKNGVLMGYPMAEGVEMLGTDKAKLIDDKSAPLKVDQKYVVRIDTYGKGGMIDEITVTRVSETLAALDIGTVGEIDYDNVDKFDAGLNSALFPFEVLLSFIVRTTANGLVWLIRWAVGGQGVTIDDIIFNKYEPTKLVFFDAEARAGNSIISAISGSINTWFSIFRNIAITGYIVILLYMGIQIMLKSTGDKQAEYKRLLVDWVMGVALLFLFPYIIKYCIELNNLLVGMIEVGKSDMNIYGEIIDTKVPYLNSESSKEEQQNFTDHFDSNPFEGEDSGASLSKTSGNYMAMMAKKADNTKRLSYAIVYMIMAWQLLMIVIAYYKRLFMVAFLLVIFPVVTLTYALDKVKDGKSQAFDVWGKEIILNIFLQTFHAIIYVFTLQVAFAGGENNNDWLLMIMGVSFLFKGEEIIKTLFGQKADSVESLGKNAIRVMATYTVLKKGVQGIYDNVFSKESHLRKGWASMNDARMYERMANNFDRFSMEPARYNVNPTVATPYNPSDLATYESSQLDTDIDTINNRDVVSRRELALALDRLQAYIKNGGSSSKLSSLGLTKEQLEGMQRIKENTVNQLDQKIDPITIDQNIKLELEVLFPGTDVTSLQQALYAQMTMPLASNHKPRNTDETFIANEIHNAQNRKQAIQDSFVFSPTGSRFTDAMEREARDLIYNVYGRDVSDAECLNMARSVVMMRYRSSGNFNVKQLSSSMKYVMDHRDDRPEFSGMIRTLGYDLDEMNYALSDKILTQYCGSDYRDNPDREPDTRVPRGISLHGSAKEDYKKRIRRACKDAKDIQSYYEGDDELKEYVQRINDLAKTFKFAENDNESDIVNTTNTFVTTHYAAELAAGTLTSADMQMARSVAILQDRNSGKYTEEMITNAMAYVSDSRNAVGYSADMVSRIPENLEDLSEALDNQKNGIYLKHDNEPKDRVGRINEITDTFILAEEEPRERDVERVAERFLRDNFVRDTYTDDERLMARSVAMLQDRNSGKYTGEMLAHALENVANNRGVGGIIGDMADMIPEDIKEMTIALDNARNGRHSYYMNSDYDEVSVGTIIRNDAEDRLNETELIEKIKTMRENRNTNERIMLSNFANYVQTHETQGEALLNGMTKEDINEMARIERSKGTQEIFKAGVTTTTALMGAPMGAAAGIAFIEGNSDSAIGEGLVGAAAGVGLADAAAERVLGGKKTRKVVLRNPYTGEDQTVTIEVDGAFSERIYSFDDPSLPSEVSAKIREQFLEAKIKKQKADAEARRKKVEKAINNRRT